MIYIVEDDASIRELCVYTLQSAGFEAVGFESGNGFFEAIRHDVPELVLLDIMLPGEDGITILKKIRSNNATKDIPVILVTAKGLEYDKVIGLDAGADDYVTKPFGMMELISRIKALLRRSLRDKEISEMICGDIVLNSRKHTVTQNNKEVLLTFKEFELLSMLMKNKGIVLTRDNILESIWGYNFDGETRTVDVHIRTLRQKLEESGDFIETIRGVGYRIDDKHKV